jgi:hypothetical protein
MSQQHLCFYSTRCRFSQSFLEELSRTPYSKEFKFVCVDPSPTRPPLPAYLKAVPTLMIKGEPEPRTDSQVMNWLSERRLQERQSSTPAVGFSSGIGGGSVNAGAGGDGLVAFGGEMFSSGDEGFAFIDDDTSTSNSAMVRLTGNMASINDIHMMVAPDSRAKAQAAGPSASKQSAKGKALDDAFESYRSMRDRDISGPPKRL